MLVKLKDIGKVVTGKTPSTKDPLNFISEVPFVTTVDLNNGFNMTHTERFISNKGFNSIFNNTISGISVLVNCIGSDMGNVGITNMTCATNQQINAITNIKGFCNPYYLYYCLILKKDYMRTIAGETAVPILSKSVFENIEIDLPSKDIQDKIVSILSNIDNQIERNNAMTKRLQVLAQTTYSRWFNQFEFPNNEGKPYKSNGGELVYNKELGKEIPIDWEVKTLGDLIKKVTPNFDYSSNLPTIDLSVMPSSSFMLNELNESKNFTSNLFAMEKGNILFGSIRPYLKKAGIAPCNGVVAGTVHQYKEIDKDFYNFALMTMVQDSFFDYALQVATGTKMPVVSSDNLLNYKVPFNKEIVKKFQDSFNLVGITCNCVMQNQELNKLKEKLLPLLINGQLNI